MGHQESFIYTTSNDIERNNQDIAQIIGMFKKYDVRTVNDKIGSCVEMVTFNEQLERFTKGMQVLWIAGDRQCQRNQWNLFDVYAPETSGFLEDERKLISRIKIIFLDSIHHIMSEILAENSTHVTIESLKLLPEYKQKKGKFEC